MPKDISSIDDILKRGAVEPKQSEKETAAQWFLRRNGATPEELSKRGRSVVYSFTD